MYGVWFGWKLTKWVSSLEGSVPRPFVVQKDYWYLSSYFKTTGLECLTSALLAPKGFKVVRPY